MKTFLTRLLASVVILVIWPILSVRILVIGLAAIWKGKKAVSPSGDFLRKQHGGIGTDSQPARPISKDSFVTLNEGTPFVFTPHKWGNG